MNEKGTTKRKDGFFSKKKMRWKNALWWRIKENCAFQPFHRKEASIVTGSCKELLMMEPKKEEEEENRRSENYSLELIFIVFPNFL